MIGETVKHYKILSEIGGGGMGLVYLAHDTDLDCKVALKFLPPELTRSAKAKTRFRLEAQSAAALQHPHICTIHAIGETEDGQMYICMPYYEGHSLKEHIAEQKLPVREVYEIASCVADGLMAAHNNDPPIIHRDIKPANIMITKTGYVVVVDFGLAKLMGRTKVTMTGVTPGTASYMSPEQVQGKDLDGRTDIWSLGVVMYEALTGETPFGSDLEQALFYQIVNEEHKPVREVRADVPQDFAAIVDKCLAKNPDDRYASMQELMTAMHDVAMKLKWQSSTTVRAVLPIQSAAEEKKQRRMRWLAVGAALAMLVAFVVYKVLPPREPPSPFVTDHRIAVLPFENNARSIVSDELVLGLTDWLTSKLTLISDLDDSSWVVPFDYTQPGRLGTPADARDALGVNELMIGSVQRFGQGMRVSLELLDATSLEPIADVDVDIAIGEFDGLAEKLLNAANDLSIAAPSEAVAAARSGDASTTAAAETGFQARGLLRKPQLAGNTEKAIDLLDAHVSAEQPNLSALLAIACLAQHRATQDESWRDRAVAVAEQALVADSTIVAPNLQLARAQHGLRQYEKAIATCERALIHEIGVQALLRTQAGAYQALERFDEAQQAYARILHEYPDRFDVHRVVGYFDNTRGHRASAEQHYRTAIELAPNDYWTLQQLGVIYHGRAEWTEARRMYLRSFAIRPDCSTCTNIGSLFYNEGLYEDAARYFEFSLSYCDSTEADFYRRWNNWAEALYWAEGRREEAAPKYRRALQLAQRRVAESPEDATAIAYVGALNAALGHSDVAIQQAERAVALAGTDGMIFMVVGWTYQRLDDRERALEHVMTAMRYKYPLANIRVEPMFAGLLEDSRFKQFIEGLRMEQDSGSASGK